MNLFQQEDIQLYYRISGSGNPVLLLHGFLEDHSMWNTIVPELERAGCQPIVFDLPCHGQNRFARPICTMAEMAKHLAAFCEHFAIEQPHVIGHSMGGYVGLELLKRIPIKLTLLHSNFWADPELKQHDRNRVIELVQYDKDRFIREAIPNLFAPTNRENCKDALPELISRAQTIPATEVIASTAGMRDREANHALLDQHTVQIIHGDADPIITTEKLESECAKLTRKPQIHTLQNCGHMSIWEKPEALINQLKLIVIK